MNAASGSQPSPGLPPSESRVPSSLVEWLSTPQAYPDHPASVQRVETHISWVFLTDRFAYKLKKPVRFDFLDFSTPQLRRRACEEELRLNRRLAPDVYLGLVAVRQDAAGNFRLEEQPRSEAATGTIAESLVKMRRLPEDATLFARIRAGRADKADAEAISDALTSFYRSAPPLAIESADYRAVIERHVRANRAELLQAEHGLDQVALKRVHGAQLRMLQLAPQAFDERVQAGRIVEGHGDLRPEHIYLAPKPVVIDCIEFNAEFRQLDVADELSFLATECDFAGAQSLGRQIFDRTLAALGDRPPGELVAFYRSYRACVRAKVAALRAKQLEGEARNTQLAEAARHLSWADRYEDQLPQPPLIVMSGLMGSGKSTLARQIAELLGAEILSTDETRQALFGKSEQAAGYGEGHYQTEDRRRVYDALLARAGELLSAGLVVILDGAFLRAELRERARRVANERNAPFRVVHCRCPDEVARQRITARLTAGKDASEARPHLLQRQREEQEPDPHGTPAVEVDTTNPLVEQSATVLSALAGGR